MTTSSRRESRVLVRSFRRAVLLAVALALAAPFALRAQEAVPTRLVVRAVAADAKVVGSGVGGVHVTVEDAATGEVLAEGAHLGGTGDTEAIMRQPHERGAEVYAGEGTAAFTAELALERPTRVRVTAEGPLDAPATSRQQTSTTLWMIPGRHLDGEGLVLELHGFLVEVVDARPDREELDVSARVRMMCGCPTRPGGLWDSERYRIHARLLREGEVVAESPMAFSGETSVYRASLPVDGAGGRGTLEVLVTDTERANVGYARSTVELP